MKLNSKVIQLGLLVLSIGLFIACGGGGGGGAVSDQSKEVDEVTNANVGNIPLKEGVFIDSAVKGVQYKSASSSGVTDDQGSFFYIDGEIVEFSLGGVILGSSNGKSVITPIDLVPDANDHNHRAVQNIVRLLQSIDDDNDPSNGIQISDIVKRSFEGTELEFDIPTSNFENDTKVVSILNANQKTLKDIDKANAHFRETLVNQNIQQNHPPVAVLSQSVFVVSTNQQLTFNAKDSHDPDGDVITFLWSQLSGPKVVLSSNTIADPFFNAPAEEANIVFRLEVFDGMVKGESKEVRVRISKPNEKPIANAGIGANVLMNEIVSLDGSQSSDPEGVSLNYLWEQVRGAKVLLSSNSIAKPTFMTPPLSGNLLFNLIVSDGEENSDVASVSITVIPENKAPVANAGEDQKVEVGTLVHIDGSGSYDEDGGLLTYVWEYSTPIDYSFELSSNVSVNPTFTPNSIGTYSFKLRVKDGEVVSEEDTMRVTVSEISLPSINTFLVSGKDNANLLKVSSSGIVDGYKIYWSTSPGVTEESHVFDSKISSFEHENLKNNQRYYYRVQAYNRLGGSDLFYERSATPPGMISFDDHRIEESVQKLVPVDMDSDGDIDIVSGNMLEAGLGWYEKKLGVFKKHLITNSVVDVVAIDVADLNNDGAKDIVVAYGDPATEETICKGYFDCTTTYERKLSWFENKGEGVFVEHQINVSKDKIEFLKFVDLNADEKIDIVVSRHSEGILSWLENDGTGQFTEHTISNEGGVKAISLVDYENDGDIDIFMAISMTGNIILFKNDGNGILSPSNIGNQASAWRICAKDMNKDGLIDACIITTDGVFCFVNKGNEVFEKTHIIQDSISGNEFYCEDIDLDGDVDIIGYSSIFFQEEGFTFYRDSLTKGASGINPFATLVDFDRDGDLDHLGSNRGLGSFYSDYDSVAVNYNKTIDHESVRGFNLTYQGDKIHLTWSEIAGADEYVVLINKDNGEIFPSEQFSTSSNTFTYEGIELGVTFYYAVAMKKGKYVTPLRYMSKGKQTPESSLFFAGKSSYDLNLEAIGQVYGKVVPDSGQLNIMIENDNAFERVKIINNLLQHDSLQKIGGNDVYLVEDVDLDMDYDIICTTNRGQNINIFYNQDDEFVKQVFTQNESNYQQITNFVSGADLNNDGVIEIVATYNNSGYIFNLDDMSYFSLINDLSWQGRYIFYDLNVDGYLDLLTTSKSNNADYEWQLNDKSGGLSNFNDLSHNLNYQPLVVPVDYDSDGDVDYISVEFSEIRLYTNDNNTFEMKKLISNSQSLMNYRGKVAMVDIDNDGDLDIPINLPSQILWFERLANGNFVERAIEQNEDYKYIWPIDLNQDGRSDFVRISTNKIQTVYQLEN